MNASRIYTVLVSDTEDNGKGVYATIRDDYGFDAIGKRVAGKEYGFWMWGVKIRGKEVQKSGYKTAKDAESAARNDYKKLNL